MNIADIPNADVLNMLLATATSYPIAEQAITILKREVLRRMNAAMPQAAPRPRAKRRRTRTRSKPDAAP